MSQLSALQGLVARKRTVEVDGVSVELRSPSAAEYRELLRDLQSLTAADRGELATDTLRVMAKVVQATVCDVPDEDFAIELIASTGGLEHSPLVLASREIIGLMGEDAQEDVQGELEEGELGN